MPEYLVRRLLLVVPTLVGISLLAFAVSHLAPGDAAAEFLRRTLDREPTAVELAATRAELGLDRPLPVQYAAWLRDAATGDLGVSYSTRRSVGDELVRRVPYTLELAVPAALLALVFAIPLACVSAMFRNRMPDQTLRVLALAGASMPVFWLALLLIMLFAVQLGVVPVAGRHGWTSAILPVAALTLAPTAVLTRFTRSALLEVLGEDYIRTAKAKGLHRWRIVGHHALRNGFIPLLTAFALTLGNLITGAVVVETIFVWPGLGSLALDAISERDYPVIQGFVLYAGVAFVLVNLMVDVAYTVVDPRGAWEPRDDGPDHYGRPEHRGECSAADRHDGVAPGPGPGPAGSGRPRRAGGLRADGRGRTGVGAARPRGSRRRTQVGTALPGVPVGHRPPRT
jgi:peptide/nickel transport system permease protein